MSSSYRGEMAPLTDKNQGNEDQNWTNKKLKVDHEIDAPHAGAIAGTVEFDGSEFHVRVDVGGRSWNFRNISYAALRDEIHRFFPKARLIFKRTRAADLALRGAAAMLQG
jgi:hypothetical protein